MAGIEEHRPGALRRLTGDAFVYGLGHAASQILGLIFLPIFTHYLTRADYGVMAWVNPFFNLLVVLIPLGLGQAVIRLVFDTEDPEEQKRIIGTGFVACMLFAAVSTPLLLLAAPTISRAFFGTGEQVFILQLAILATPGAVLRYYVLSVLRARMRKWSYGLVSLTSVLLLGLFNVLMVVVLERGVEGIFLGGLISLTTVGLLAIGLIRSDLRLGLSWPRLRRMLAYGAPLAPAALAFWALSYIDRSVLLKLEGAAQVGLYDVGSKIAAIVAFATFAISQAYLPLSYEIAQQPDSRRSYGRILTAYVAGMGWLVLGLCAFAGEALSLLAAEKFHGAIVVVPWLVSAVAIAGAAPILATGIHLAKRTVWVTAISVIAALTNLVLNLWWVRAHGIVGAAAATLASYVLMTTLYAVVAERLHPIRFPWARAGAAVGAAAAGILTVGGTSGLLPRVLVVAAYPVVLVALRVVGVGDLRRLTRLT
jgi:O-antigen/teichoic acid export membrane protein